MAAARTTHTLQRTLGDCPSDVIERVVAHLPPQDLAAANAASCLFRGASGGRSPVEHALRERARARGHARALPPTLPAGVGTWTEELFARERLLVLTRAHAPPVAAGERFSAFVHGGGGLHTCGEEEVRDEDGWRTGEYRADAATGHPGVLAVRVPTRVLSLSAGRVVAVAAGWAHLLALSEAGAVYGCGKNGFGQRGLGDTEERSEFVPAGALGSAAVVGIAAGGQRNLALSAAGCAYS